MNLDEIYFVLQFLDRQTLDSLQIFGEEYRLLSDFIAQKDEMDAWDRIKKFYSQ